MSCVVWISVRAQLPAQSDFLASRYVLGGRSLSLFTWARARFEKTPFSWVVFFPLLFLSSCSCSSSFSSSSSSFFKFFKNLFIPRVIYSTSRKTGHVHPEQSGSRKPTNWNDADCWTNQSHGKEKDGLFLQLMQQIAGHCFCSSCNK